MFEPMIFPRDRSGALFITASIETNSSDNEVPNPIITIPITNSDKFNFFPIDTALETNISAPFTTKTRPKIKFYYSFFLFVNC